MNEPVNVASVSSVLRDVGAGAMNRPAVMSPALNAICERRVTGCRCRLAKNSKKNRRSAEVNSWFVMIFVSIVFKSMPLSYKRRLIRPVQYFFRHAVAIFFRHDVHERHAHRFAPAQSLAEFGNNRRLLCVLQ